MDSSYEGLINFRTGEIDWLDQPPSDYSDYIPQYDSVQEAYQGLIRLGETPQEACLRVLKACIGENE